MTLKPVLIHTPAVADLPPSDRVAAQGGQARIALARCAEMVGAPPDGWMKDARDAPARSHGFHWSISHTRELAGAVIAVHPVGIDVEQIRPRKPELFEHVAGPVEWDQLGARTWENFFRMWTAKEAVLKANGIGIGWLRECRLTQLVTDSRLQLSFRGVEWNVEHYQSGDHIAAVTCGDAPVQWQVYREAC